MPNLVSQLTVFELELYIELALTRGNHAMNHNHPEMVHWIMDQWHDWQKVHEARPWRQKLREFFFRSARPREILGGDIILVRGDHVAVALETDGSMIHFEPPMPTQAGLFVFYFKQGCTFLRRPTDHDAALLTMGRPDLLPRDPYMQGTS